MPDAHPPERTAGERAADHAAIDRLTDELLPALVAKLGATGLGELEVHEGPWRVRLRRPSGSVPASGGRRRERSDRADRADRAESSGDRTAERAAERPGRPGHHASDGPSARSASRSVATSPAVGIYRPRTDLAAGTRVRAGDRLGAVDMLGIPQEVVAPVDGIVGASLAESGDAVEYGQELLVVEFAPSADRGRADVP
ncbi:MAG: acetyl-CoA carboxylase biotin carboxyl carrier protein [Candidatus Limnocylindrales bacterium]